MTAKASVISIMIHIRFSELIWKNRPNIDRAGHIARREDSDDKPCCISSALSSCVFDNSATYSLVERFKHYLFPREKPCSFQEFCARLKYIMGLSSLTTYTRLVRSRLWALTEIPPHMKSIAPFSFQH